LMFSASNRTAMRARAMANPSPNLPEA